MGSAVVVHWLGCSAVCGILVPQSVMEPISPALQGRFLTPGLPGMSQSFILLENIVSQTIIPLLMLSTVCYDTQKVLGLYVCGKRSLLSPLLPQTQTPFPPANSDCLPEARGPSG